MEEPKAVLDVDLRIQLPNHALIVGASQSGKTRLGLYFFNHPELFHPKPSKILFWYDQYQDIYAEAKTNLMKHDIEMLLIKGFNKDFKLDNFEKSDKQVILFVDDFSEEAVESRELAKIATNG